MENFKTKIKQVLHTFKSWSREFPGGPVVRTCAFTAMAWVQFLAGELRPHKPGAARKKERERDSISTLQIY